MRYLEKALPTRIGAYCNFWIVTNVDIDTIQGTAVVKLKGWLTEALYIEGKRSAGNKRVRITDVFEMDVYESVAQAVIAKLLATDTFADAEIKEIEESGA